jgi:hypothetical protein
MPEPEQRRKIMRAGKIAAIVVGALLVLISLALILPGGFLLWVHGTQRDEGGFYATSGRVLSSDGYALVTPDVHLDSEPWSWLSDDEAATVRFRADSNGDTPIFIGIGPADEVAHYLANVAHDEVTDVDGWFQAVDYRHLTGGAPLTTPDRQDFWVAKQEGSGELTLEWPLEGGDWTAVMMNADGSAHVTSSVSVAGRLNILLPIGVGLAGAGIVLLAIGIVLIVLGARRDRFTAPTPQAPYSGQAPLEPQAGV